MRVYVAGPYTKGDTGDNLRKAVWAGESLILRKHIPYIPHLNYIWNIIAPHDPNFWYEYDLVWLRLCEALFRVPGESVGADAEVKLARQLGLPVWTDMNEVPYG